MFISFQRQRSKSGQAPREKGEGRLSGVRRPKLAHPQKGKPQSKTFSAQTDVKERLDEISGEPSQSKTPRAQFLRTVHFGIRKFCIFF